jgi:DNA gyrase subunit A
MELAEKKEELLVVTKNGFGKRTPVREYKIQARGGKGLLTYDKSKFDKTGELVGAMVVADDDEVFLINSDGIIIRIRANEVSKLGRTTQGVKIMKVEEGTEIVAMAKGPRDDVDEAESEAPKKKAKEPGEDSDEQLSLL